MSTRIRYRKRRKLKRKRVLFFSLLAVMVIAFLSVGSWGVYLYVKANNVVSQSYEDNGKQKSALREKAVDPSEDNVSVLIIGVDESDKRENEGNALSDTLIMATLNKKDKSVKMLSIPRDSYVFVPEVGYKTKINHAHAYGGTEATVDAVEQLLDIPVDYYAKVNFNAFIEVVDAIDGVKVDVPYELYEQNSKDVAGAIHLLPGEQLLDGEEALALARTRKLDNDIQRGKRQQDIIKSVVRKSASLGSIFKYDNILDALGDNMTTNMSFPEMKSFITYGTEGSNLDFETLTLEGEDYWVYEPQKIYYYQLDEHALMETRHELKAHLDIDDSPQPYTNKQASSTDDDDSEETQYTH